MARIDNKYTGNQGNPKTMHSATITTDVAIVGNGPSGISLSYILSGNWPYFNNNWHPDPYLLQKLKEDPQKSIVEQDLEYLSDGLEGRSSNPVSLLFDALHHPNADLGCSEPTTLEWRYNPEKRIPHVVLGKGPPGGTWQNMKNSKLTLSLRNWMEMPGFSFTKWLKQNHSRQEKMDSGDDDDDNDGGDDGDDDDETRASFSDVSKYYTDYIEAVNIQENFLSHVHVKSVRRVKGRTINCESGETECVADAGPAGYENPATLFEVICQQDGEVEGQPYDFKIHARNVVLASGISDLPSRLEVPGEDLPFVGSQLPELERAVENGEIGPASDPVVVVGAGLSAADVVLYARQKGVPVVQVVRRSVHDPAIILKQLPAAVYPEYKQVYEMMKGGADSTDGFQCYDKCQVREFRPNNTVVIAGPDSCRLIKASKVMVMIGSRPNLSYLCCSGQTLGSNPKQPITKNNPIMIDQMSNESVVSPGLYAMGALVGSNFVRFLTGGALAIVNNLVRSDFLEKTQAED